MRKPRHRLRSALWRPHRLSKPRIIRRPRCASGGARRRCNGDDRAQPGNRGGLRAEAATRMRGRGIEVDVRGGRTARGAGHERRLHGRTEAGLSQGYPAEGKRWRQKLDARSRKVDREEGRHRGNADECSFNRQANARVETIPTPKAETSTLPIRGSVTEKWTNFVVREKIKPSGGV